ncbi:hypothetical protein [Acaryochloris marina]|uniref:hypothetical protein n=1 Tax=Acaryochloris marina TaxID=155978 RepID=UPI0021C30455|nr:hypothetical protein [Acaryochloris marina]BDM83086.1 hypothetical protein AM10699_59470 [Acaryochloris marina MBIC10699]
MEPDNFFKELSREAKYNSRIYQKRQNRLIAPNLITVLLPALLSTIVAIISGIEAYSKVDIAGIPVASLLSGLSAILITIHRTLKCDEYQAECLRLANLYDSISTEAKYISLLESLDLEKEGLRLIREMASASRDKSILDPHLPKTESKNR